jgi:hypothetical protein
LRLGHSLFLCHLAIRKLYRLGLAFLISVFYIDKNIPFQLLSLTWQPKIYAD